MKQYTEFESVDYDNEPVRHSDYKANPRSIRRFFQHVGNREFIAWDGEGIHIEPKRVPSEFVLNWMNQFYELHGELPPNTEDWYDVEEAQPQPYVLLANSKHERITCQEGLSTEECFHFILGAKHRHPHTIFVGFSINYDIAQMLKDLNERKLEMLYRTNVCYYRGFRIEWRPRRWLRLTYRPVGAKKGDTVTVYDSFGFFQSSFLSACEKYLGRDDPDLNIIQKGKAARDTFTWEELDDFIIPYNDMELKMLVRMMNQLRDDLHKIGLDLGTSWYGPGAVANKLLHSHGVRKYKSKDNIPEEVSVASQYGYAGGRFEQYGIGCYEDTVYEYDIRSAYPKAASLLPILSDGHWEYTETFEPEAFGIWSIDYTGHTDDPYMPEPLFCRSPNGSISFPDEVSGWYWGPEASLVPDYVRHGYCWRPDNSLRPFAFVEPMYEQRASYKAQKIACERAIKLALNSIYGKLAQTIGGRNGPPSWHQLEWAGWITSYVRAMIYRAILLNPTSIISCETDAVFSKEPLELNVGPGLGEWELTKFKSITYIQSGFYYATTEDDEVICRYRGMDGDRETKQPVGLPYWSVLDHLSNGASSEHRRLPPLRSNSTRFISLGLGLRTRATFRSWETSKKTIYLDQRTGQLKRRHLADKCVQCQMGYNLRETLHDMPRSGYYGRSFPHHLPWKPIILDPEMEDYLTFLGMEEQSVWQD